MLRRSIYLLKPFVFVSVCLIVYIQYTQLTPHLVSVRLSVLEFS